MKINKKDCFLAIIGSILSVFLGSYFIDGSFLPHFSYPLTYSGDGLQFLFEIQRVIEKGLLFNERSGFPFGSSFADFTSSEDGHLFILKLLGKMSGSSVFALNGYIYLSFFLNFLSTYLVSRLFKISQTSSFVCASLFNFIPFHFQRLGHLFYILYFHIPIFFYIAFQIFQQPNTKTIISFVKTNYIFLITLFFLAFFGVYSAVFSCILFAASGIASASKNKSIKSLIKETLCIVFICLGVLTNLIPSIIYKIQNGKNHEIAVRHFFESEIYGLKASQLVLPRDSHRVDFLAKLKNKYNTAPLCNENSTATLGFFGSIGFIALSILLIMIPFNSAIDIRLSFFAISTYLMFLSTTIGGLSVLFSLFISPLIRGWNRISPFIAFASIASFSIVLTESLKKIKSSFLKKVLPFIIIVLGVLDQTTQSNKEAHQNAKSTYLNNKKFVESIEKILPKESPVFQYPYIPFPEYPPMHAMETYEPTKGFILSQTLRWNYAGMKGRSSDLFYRNLNNESYEVQLDIIKKLGFQGIYIDTAAYSDGGKEIISAFSKLIGEPPKLISDGGRFVFFKIPNVSIKNFNKLTPQEIMTKIGYIADKYGKRYNATLSDGIDFTKDGFPKFIKDIKGLSHREFWGRWSKAKEVAFDFTTKLPKNFNLRLKANVFGTNVGKELKILINGEEFMLPLNTDPIDTSINIHLNEESKRIKFIIPEPQAPNNIDKRKIGLGFISLKIEEII